MEQIDDGRIETILAIELAIDGALKRQSKIDEVALSVPMLGSLNIRHLLNNLGYISNHYLDVGPHKGGSFCSAVYKNKLLSATAVDCFASDEGSYDKAQPQFLANAAKCLHPDTQLTLLVSDAFQVDLSKIPYPIDLYNYDAAHAEIDQKMALTYYLPCLADTFILCVDDYAGVDGCNDVKTGTQKGIAECELEVLFEREFITDKPYDNDSFWNGYYLALLRKKS